MHKAKFIIFLLIFSLSFISCQHFSKKIINEKEDFKIEIKIDSIFMQFDIEKYENYIKILGDIEDSYPYEIIDSTYFIIPGELVGGGYYQLGSTLGDSIFYDTYQYYSNGILRYKSRNISGRFINLDTIYLFNEEGELIELVEYQKCESIDIYGIIELLEKEGFTYSDPSLLISISYKEKKEYKKDNITYIKYNIPVWKIEISAPYKYFHIIRINGLNGEIETNLFSNEEFLICEEGSVYYIIKDHPLFEKSFINHTIYKKNKAVF